jgi:hypothetical protein
MKHPKGLKYLISFYILMFIFSIMALESFDIAEIVNLFITIISIYGLIKGYKLSLMYFRMLNHFYIAFLIFGSIAIYYPNDLMSFSGSMSLYFISWTFSVGTEFTYYIFIFLVMIHTYIIYRKDFSEYCSKNLVEEDSNYAAVQAKSFITKNRIPISIYSSSIISILIVGYSALLAVESTMKEITVMNSEMITQVLESHYNNGPTEFDNLASVLVSIQEKFINELEVNSSSRDDTNTLKRLEESITSIKSSINLSRESGITKPFTGQRP